VQVSKWGNSLAVRLPSAVVDALGLKEGDEIEISVAGKRDFRVARDQSKKKALETIRRLAACVESPKRPLAHAPPVRSSSCRCSPVHDFRSSPIVLLARGSIAPMR